MKISQLKQLIKEQYDKNHKVIISENLKYHLNNKLSLTENTFRYGSQAFLDLWHEARELLKENKIIITNPIDLEILNETDLGEYDIYEGELVPLDLPMLEEQEETTEFNINKVWDFIGSRPFYNKDYMPKFNTAEEIWDKWGPEEKQMYTEFEWKDTYGNKLHPRELANMKRQANYNALKGLKEVVEEWPKEVFSRHRDMKFILQKSSSDKATYQIVDLENNNKEIGTMTFGSVFNLKDFANDYIKPQGGTISTYLGEIKDKKKTPPIGKPKRGGSKKFYVYVRDKGKIKKVSFGDTTGLSAKINNPKARKAFAARHDCKNKKDKTKASYWSCRLPRYSKLLGLKSSFSGFW
jgi:hypothetical protein